MPDSIFFDPIKGHGIGIRFSKLPASASPVVTLHSFSTTPSLAKLPEQQGF
jgi:hypothetical protein